MKKILYLILLLLAFACNSFAQVYSNVIVEVNLISQLSSLNVSAPFVWCRENNTLYYFDANLNTFTPYPSNTVVSVNGASGVVVLTKSDLGLSNVDNTSDATKNAANVSLTNKTISGASNTLSNIAESSVTNLTTDLAAKVALTQPYGYTVNIQGLTSSPVDASTIFFGDIPRAPTTTAATSQIFIRKAGTIKVAQVYCFSGTAGTNEAWSISIRLNNSTDTLIQTVSLSNTVRTFTNSSLNIVVAAGDYVEIKSVNPTWATNPLTTVFGGYLYIE
jgi:hypothetical protein